MTAVESNKRTSDTSFKTPAKKRVCKLTGEDLTERIEELGEESRELTIIATRYTGDVDCSAECPRELYPTLKRSLIGARNLMESMKEMDATAEILENHLPKEFIESFDAYTDLCIAQCKIRGFLMDKYYLVRKNYARIKKTNKSAAEIMQDSEMKALEIEYMQYCMTLRSFYFIFRRAINQFCVTVFEK